jgi:allantoinase
MSKYDLVLRAQRAITLEGERAVAVAIKDGVIAALLDLDAEANASEEIAIEGILLPGVVDTHVHINEPGRTEWEGFETATRAAAVGGVTTLIDMPLNSIPPTVDVEALHIKRAAAQGKCSTDMGFWGGSIPGNVAHLRPLHEAGVFGFKSFLLHSGVDEFPGSSEADLDSALKEIASFDGLMIIHAEDADVIELSAKDSSPEYQDFLESRPDLAESIAIAQVIDTAQRHDARVHVLHLSSAQAIEQIAAAKRDGVKITAETCPHYLTLASDDIPSGATQFKCCPPIRSRVNQDLLWKGLTDGVIDMIVSDHSPCTVDLKKLDVGDFQAAWGGISSLQLGLSIIWSDAAARGINLASVVRWMSTQPAAFAGLSQKGAIAVGRDADLIAFDPDRQFTVDPQQLQHRNPVTPYAGKSLRGVVTSTWLRGTLVAHEGELLGTPQGRFLTR